MAKRQQQQRALAINRHDCTVLKSSTMDSQMMIKEYIFLKDEYRVSDRYFDALCQDANRQIGGGIKYVLTSHTHQLISLYKMYDAA
eukprot:15340808-Ditylum_brightwellii.AAC.1